MLAMPNTGHQIHLATAAAILVTKSFFLLVCFVFYLFLLLLLFFFSTETFLSTSIQFIFLLSTLFFMHDSGPGSVIIWVAMTIREPLKTVKQNNLKH